MPRTHPQWSAYGTKPTTAWSSESGTQDQVLSLEAEVRRLKKENGGLREIALPQLQKDVHIAQSEASKAKEYEDKCKQLAQRVHSLSAERDDLETKLHSMLTDDLLGDSEKKAYEKQKEMFKEIFLENRKLKEVVRRLHSRQQQFGGLSQCDSLTLAGPSEMGEATHLGDVSTQMHSRNQHNQSSTLAGASKVSELADMSHISAQDSQWKALAQDMKRAHAKTLDKVKDLTEQNKILTVQLKKAKKDAAQVTQAKPEEIENLQAEIDRLREQLSSTNHDMHEMREMPLRSFWLGLEKRCESARGTRPDENRPGSSGLRSPSPHDFRTPSPSEPHSVRKSHLAPLNFSHHDHQKILKWESDKEAFLATAQREADKLQDSAANAQALLKQIEYEKKVTRSMHTNSAQSQKRQSSAGHYHHAIAKDQKLKENLERQGYETKGKVVEYIDEDGSSVAVSAKVEPKQRWSLVVDWPCKDGGEPLRETIEHEKLQIEKMTARRDSQSDFAINQSLRFAQAAERSVKQKLKATIAQAAEQQASLEGQLAAARKRVEEAEQKGKTIEEENSVLKAKNQSLLKRCWVLAGQAVMDPTKVKESFASFVAGYNTVGDRRGSDTFVAEKRGSDTFRAGQDLAAMTNKDASNGNTGPSHLAGVEQDVPACSQNASSNDGVIQESAAIELSADPGSGRPAGPALERAETIPGFLERTSAETSSDKLHGNAQDLHFDGTSGDFDTQPGMPAQQGSKLLRSAITMPAHQQDGETSTEDPVSLEQTDSVAGFEEQPALGRFKTSPARSTAAGQPWETKTSSKADRHKHEEWELVVQKLSRALHKEHLKNCKWKDSDSGMKAMSKKEKARSTKGIYEFISDWANNEEFEELISETCPSIANAHKELAARVIQRRWKIRRVINRAVTIQRFESKGLCVKADVDSSQLDGKATEEESQKEQLALPEHEKDANEAQEIAMEKMAEGYLAAFQKAGGQQAVRIHMDDVNEAIRNLKSLRIGQDCKQDCAYELLDLDELFADTEALNEDYQKEIQRIAQATKGYCVPGKIKGRRRTRTKCFMKFGNDASCLNDLMRASISYESIDDLYNALLYLLSTDLDRVDFRVLTVEDRIQKPAPGNYRDVQMVVQFDGMSAELQLHLQDLLEVKKTHGHGGYEVQRSLSEALFMAAVKNKPSYVKALLHQFPRAVQMSKDKNGRRALHYGCQHGSFSVIKVLLDFNADPWYGDDEEVLPVELAFLNRNWDVAARVLQFMFLRRAESPVHQPRQFIRLANIARWWIDHIGYAGHDSSQSKFAAIKLCNLLNSNPKEEASIASTLTAWLRRDVEAGHEGCVTALLEMGVQPSTPLPDETTSPLELALLNGFKIIAEKLIKAKVTYLVQYDSLESHLLMAATQGSWESLSAVLQLKADPTCCENISGRTPLMIVAASGEVGTLYDLLYAKADIFAEDMFHARAIDYATACKRNAIVGTLSTYEKMALEQQADAEMEIRFDEVQKQANRSKSVVQTTFAESTSDMDRNKMDIIQESDEDDSDEDGGLRIGRTKTDAFVKQSLHEAAFRGCVGAMAFIMDTSIRTDISAIDAPIRNVKYKKNWLNEQNETGSSPLICALQSANVMSVDPGGYMAAALLDASADVHVTDNRQYTALHWAAMRFHKDAYDLLKKAGASEEAENLQGEKPPDLLQQAERYQARDALNSYAEEQKGNEQTLIHVAFFAFQYIIWEKRMKRVEDPTQNVEALRRAKEFMIREQEKKKRQSHVQRGTSFMQASTLKMRQSKRVANIFEKQKSEKGEKNLGGTL